MCKRFGMIVIREYRPGHRWVDRRLNGVQGKEREVRWMGNNRLIQNGASLMQVCRQTRQEVTPILRENTSFLVRERELMTFESVFGGCDREDLERYNRAERNEGKLQDEEYVLVKVRGTG